MVFHAFIQVYYKEAVGAFVVFDVTRLSTFEAVQMWKADLDNKVLLPNGKPIPAVLLANKVGERERKRERERECSTFCFYFPLYSVISQMKVSLATSTSLMTIVERRASMRGLRHQQRRMLELMRQHVV